MEMKIIRFWDGERVSYGVSETDSVRIIEGDLFGENTIGDRVFDKRHIQILAPCEPSKVICIGLNYHDHAKEVSMEIPTQPVVFLKPSSAVTGTGTSIIYPPQCTRLDYEAELAIVMKDIAQCIEPEEAPAKILGFTCANDITARNLQPMDGQWTLAKSFDTFCPIGPHIETNIDPSNLSIKLYLNGELKQDSNTSQMIFSVDYIISYLSKHMTLFPGDVIITGTSPGISAMKAGDTVEVDIEGIGKLVNTVTMKK